jgi:hypothetical protein
MTLNTLENLFTILSIIEINWTEHDFYVNLFGEEILTDEEAKPYLKEQYCLFKQSIVKFYINLDKEDQIGFLTNVQTYYNELLNEQKRSFKLYKQAEDTLEDLWNNFLENKGESEKEDDQMLEEIEDQQTVCSYLKTRIIN